MYNRLKERCGSCCPHPHVLSCCQRGSGSFILWCPRHYGVKVLHASGEMSGRPLNSIIWSVSSPCFVRPQRLPYRSRFPIQAKMNRWSKRRSMERALTNEKCTRPTSMLVPRRRTSPLSSKAKLHVGCSVSGDTYAQELPLGMLFLPSYTASVTYSPRCQKYLRNCREADAI